MQLTPYRVFKPLTGLMPRLPIPTGAVVCSSHYVVSFNCYMGNLNDLLNGGVLFSVNAVEGENLQIQPQPPGLFHLDLPS